MSLSPVMLKQPALTSSAVPVRFGADNADNNKPKDPKKPEPNKSSSLWGNFGDVLPKWLMLAGMAQNLVKETANKGMEQAYSAVLGQERNKRINDLEALSKKANVQAEQSLLQALYQQLKDKYNKPVELLNLKTVDTAIDGIEADLRKKVDARLGAGQFDKLMNEIKNKK
jgi:hypothetical protein